MPSGRPLDDDLFGILVQCEGCFARDMKTRDSILAIFVAGRSITEYVNKTVVAVFVMEGQPVDQPIGHLKQRGSLTHIRIVVKPENV